MSYHFRSHREAFKRALLLFPPLFLAQIPEGLLNIIQKHFETHLAQTPVLAFSILYPLYCASSAICSAISYTIIKDSGTTDLSFSYLIKKIVPHLRALILGSWILGVVMIPATLALVFPGIWVLSHYQFLPFSIVDSSNSSLTSCFDSSKSVSLRNRTVSLLTAFSSFFIGLLSYLGFGMISQASIHSSFALGIEVVLGMILSVFLTAWTATLYQEASKP